MQKYYDVLELSSTATPEEIKKAYKKKARETHPDLNGGSDEKFKEVTEAYEILSGKRQSKSRPEVDDTFDVDRMREIFERMQNSGFGPFSSQFRRAQNRPPEKDSDVHFSFQLSAEQIKQGKVLEVQYVKSVFCKKCNGVGGSSKKACHDCHGSGVVQRIETHGTLQFASLSPCMVCTGNGTIVENPCGECQANGYTKSPEKLKFEVKEVK